MNIQYVSLTGADDKTDIKELEQFSAEFPKYECAILYFPERDGLARNPSLAWREKFYASSVKQRALHVCGSGINQLAEENPQLLSEIQNFNRVQINLKPQYASVPLVEQLVKVVTKLNHINFITQYNEVNQDYFRFWNPVSNHSYLFDASLGKGKTPETWQPPVAGKFTGYAGGLSDSNILENLHKIAPLTGNTAVWIDMESGVRTNDEFDLAKARRVLEITKNFQHSIKLKP